MPRLSGVNQSLVLGAFRYLRLIDDYGTPTQALQELLTSDGDDWQRRLRQIIVSAYDTVFTDGFDMKVATPRELEERLSRAGVSGDTIRKCMAFLVAAARDAGMEVSPYLTSGRVIRNRTRGGRKARPIVAPRPKAEATQSPSEEEQPYHDTLDAGHKTIVRALVDKFPEFDPNWSPDLQEKWFAAFTKLMERVAPDKQ